MVDVTAGGASIAPKRPWHLWVIAVLSLLWNAMGGFDFTMTNLRNAEYLTALTPEQMAWIESFPVWAIVGWGVGVWGSILGSILLLLGHRWAVGAFALSLVGVAVTTIFQFGVSNMPASLNTAGGVAFHAAIWIVALALLWYSAKMRARGVLR